MRKSVLWVWPLGINSMGSEGAHTEPRASRALNHGVAWVVMFFLVPSAQSRDPYHLSLLEQGLKMCQEEVFVASLHCKCFTNRIDF